MAVNVSPGVYTKIVDLSEYVRVVPSTIGFIPIISEKGPDNELVFTNSRDFYKDFGEPDINYAGAGWGQGPYVASAFLEQSDALFVTRVLPNDATYANIVLAVTGNLGNADSTADVSIAWSKSPNVTSTSEFDTLIDTTDGSGESTQIWPIVFYGIGRGAYYNNLKLSIDVSSDYYLSNQEAIYYVRVWEKQKERDPNSVSGDYPYKVVESFEVSFDYTHLGDDGRPNYVEDTINDNSKYIRCISNREKVKLAVDDGADWSEPFQTYDNEAQAVDTTYTGLPAYYGPVGQASATNPYPASTASEVGDPVMGATVVKEQPMAGRSGDTGYPFGGNGALFDGNGNIETGEAEALLTRCYKGILPKPTTDQTSDPTYLREIIDKEEVYFSLAFDAGYPAGGVKSAVEYLCKTRGDCVGIVDNGDNYKAETALNKRKGNVQGFTSNLNNKGVAIYEGYTKIFDQFKARDIWISPCYHMAKIIPFSDNASEIWYAPAGFNRASISNIKEMRYSPNLAQRDQFYLNQLNPIVKFIDTGTVVYGQLTSQRRPTSLQDLNVVRMVLYAQRAIEQFAKFYIFEQNDSDTWEAIGREVNSFLNVIKARRGLRSFTVEVGATDYELKAKQAHINVTLVPTKTLEQIHLTFFIQ